MVGNYLVPYAVCSSSSSLLRPLVACFQNPTIVIISTGFHEYQNCLPGCYYRVQYSLQRGVQTGRDKHGEKVIDQERAASTAEEFLKIAEEKAEQGIGSQTADEAADHVVEEITSDPGGDIDANKEKLKPGMEEETFINTP